MTDESARSEPPATISQMHDQDWLIIVEALAAWGGDPQTVDSSAPRKGRAWDLMSTIASERGFPEGNPLKQVDDAWGAMEDTDG
ncbi:hypothetical protein [Halococcus sp. PRR34]|uniref:hypothetical protein n=1 Tax=Halococcus sp. PRR34 TaxID=3020830 RepID=UPI00235E8603|nr:hypothetical protein [Halococcus sp. PRR34]